ncbi:MAG: (2Fe-2S) ferredoxin domain-containing protein [Chloroflexaceae bacterium]|nr:(2Fe-2S) ferredoxin domain-containing protein [Chloroflexaceae bacterium]
MTNPLDMNPYRHHILLCTGRYCDPAGRAAALYALLPRLLGELGHYDNPCRVKRGTTPCLGVCSGGPLLVVYPEGIWYHHVDETLLQQIITEHLEEGRPLWQHVFHQLEQPGTACPKEPTP